MENTNMNYGHQLKVTRYMTQRAYLEGMLNHHIENPSNDGDFSESYIGHLFPENVLWLNENGIKVHTERITDASHKFFCYELNLFTIADDIILSEEDVKKSEEHFANVLVKIAEENFNKAMSALGISPNDDDECDTDEYDDEDEFDPGDPYYNDGYSEDEDFRLAEFDDDEDFALPDEE